MKRGGLLGAGALLAMSLANTSTALAQADVDFGKREYMANCAVCHGTAGNGAGYYEGFLKQKPTDLTLLAKRNGGIFPYQSVYEVIDGRRQVAAHGSRDMPVWGDDYYAKGATYETTGVFNPETYVRARILSLVDYLYRIQAQ
jgi:mono/diheme cytochrome c family protein